MLANGFYSLGPSSFLVQDRQKAYLTAYPIKGIINSDGQYHSLLKQVEIVRSIYKDRKEIFNQEIISYIVTSGHLNTIKYLESEGAEVLSTYLLYYLQYIPVNRDNRYHDVLRYFMTSNNDAYKAMILNNLFFEGAISFIKEIVAQDPTILEKNKSISLQNAISHGHLNLVKFLISQVDMPINGPLLQASASGRLNIVKYLVSQGADVNYDKDVSLRYASSYGHLNVVKYLLSQGANKEAEGGEAMRFAKINKFSGVYDYLKLENRGEREKKFVRNIYIKELINKL